MSIQNVSKENIIDAIKYIDVNGIPEKNRSSKYEIVLENGNKYPPKYVIAVAEHIAYGTEIDISGFNTIEAKNYLQKRGFIVDIKQEKYELTITSNDVCSTDERFTMDNLELGDNYKPLDVYFVNEDGKISRRNYGKGERRNSNQTMPRLACQIFERQIIALSGIEKEQFPICRYSLNGELMNSENNAIL